MNQLTETYTLKVLKEGAFVWHKKKGKLVKLTSRKALRNYIRNNFTRGEQIQLYCNDKPTSGIQ